MSKRARITVYDMIGGDRVGSDHQLAEWELDGSIRLQNSKSFDLESIIFGARMIDGNGDYATDFEHDGAWRFRCELILMQFTMVTERWFEWKGMVSELSAYTPEEEAEVWADGVMCGHCTGKKEDGNGPHLILGDHYVPPKLKQYRNKFAVIRMFDEDE